MIGCLPLEGNACQRSRWAAATPASCRLCISLPLLLQVRATVSAAQRRCAAERRCGQQPGAAPAQGGRAQRDSLLPAGWGGSPLPASPAALGCVACCPPKYPPGHPCSHCPARSCGAASQLRRQRCPLVWPPCLRWRVAAPVGPQQGKARLALHASAPPPLPWWMRAAPHPPSLRAGPPPPSSGRSGSRRTSATSGMPAPGRRTWHIARRFATDWG